MLNNFYIKVIFEGFYVVVVIILLYNYNVDRKYIILINV